MNVRLVLLVHQKVSSADARTLSKFKSAPIQKSLAYTVTKPAAYDWDPREATDLQM